MEERSTSVGLDVHKDTIAVAMLRPRAVREEGERARRSAGSFRRAEGTGPPEIVLDAQPLCGGCSWATAGVLHEDDPDWRGECSLDCSSLTAELRADG